MCDFNCSVPPHVPKIADFFSPVGQSCSWSSSCVAGTSGVWLIPLGSFMDGLPWN